MIARRTGNVNQEGSHGAKPPPFLGAHLAYSVTGSSDAILETVSGKPQPFKKKITELWHFDL